MSQKHKALAINTALLYLLNFSAYAFALLLIPYETRVLGAENFGIISFATTVMGYFQLVIGFGFMLSATEEVSRHRDDPRRVSGMVWSVTAVKLALALVCLLALGGVMLVWDRMRAIRSVLFPYYIYTVLSALVPDFLFRGLEKMHAVTYRSVLVRAVTVVLVFLLIKKPQDYALLPWLFVLESVASLAISFWYAKRLCGLGRISVAFKDIAVQMRRSVPFFLSRIASGVYTTSNTVVLGAACGMAQVGLYASVSKLIVTGQTMLQPLADSLYPYMVRNRDFKLARRLLLVGVPLVCACCLAAALLADRIVVALFGAEFAGAAAILRWMLPVVAFSFPNYIIAFPVLGALGLSAKSNFANIAGAAFHAAQLALLGLTGSLTPERVALAYSATECLVLAYRVALLASALRKRKKEDKRSNEEDRAFDAALHR